MKKIRKSLELKKLIKRKGDKLYVKWKDCNWSNKKDIVLMIKYFPKTKFSGASVEIQLDLANYATKADLKNATGVVDTSVFTKKN